MRKVGPFLISTHIHVYTHACTHPRTHLHIVVLAWQYLQEVGQRVLLLQDEVVGGVGAEDVEDAVNDGLTEVAGGGAQEGIVEDAEGIDVLHAGSWVARFPKLKIVL